MEPKEKPLNLFKIVNVEWEHYVPRVTDAPKEKLPPESAVRKIMNFEGWKETRQDIDSMEVDHVAM